ncbi:uncharacterized protein LOC143179339 [Calliopsis andreniformis]|uniref:uncharacterized protein LOC143179339 n=1 Tax=Calliopsis andreniformis TaxID=337506 RepID=UPI003FCCF97D
MKNFSLLAASNSSQLSALRRSCRFRNVSMYSICLPTFRFLAYSVCVLVKRISVIARARCRKQGENAKVKARQNRLTAVAARPLSPDLPDRTRPRPRKTFFFAQGPRPRSNPIRFVSLRFASFWLRVRAATITV